MGAWNTIKP